jgi:hypothetical protein
MASTSSAKVRNRCLLTSRSIGQPLADCPFKRDLRAHGVVDAKAFAGGLPEIKLSGIAVHVLGLDAIETARSLLRGLPASATAVKVDEVLANALKD